MPAIANTEWLNQNAYRAYPFEENAHRTPVDAVGNLLEGIQLPNYVVVDFTFAIAGDPATRLYLSRLAIVSNLLTLVFAETVTGQTVSTVTVDRGTHVANQGYVLVGSGSWEDGRGRVVVGDLTELDTDLGDGLYQFTADATQLEATTVKPDEVKLWNFESYTSGTSTSIDAVGVLIVEGTRCRSCVDKICRCDHVTLS